MAISPKEIMKGSIVSYEGKPRIVKGIMDYIILEGTKEWVGGSLMNGEPISEVWLQHLGFVFDNNENFWAKGMLIIRFNVDSFWHSPDAAVKYHYVHQLQILFFAYTGQHLVIPKLK